MVSTHIQLHSVARDLHVNVVEFSQRFIDMTQDLSDAIVRFQEGMYIGL